MKKVLFICITLFFTSYVSSQVYGYNIGDTVNDFTVIDTYGESHNLYDITATGKYVFLDFFFRNCPPCQSTSRFFYQLYETYGLNQEHTYMMSLSPIDNNATITEFENLYNGGFPPPPAAGTEGNAPAVIDDFDIRAYPTYCIVGPDNTLLVGDIWPVSGMENFENSFPEGLLNLLSVHDVKLYSQVVLYPTVSDGNFTVKLPNGEIAELWVYDLTGKNIYKANHTSSEIQVNLNLADGIYLVKIVSNGKASVKKILIKN